MSRATRILSLVLAALLLAAVAGAIVWARAATAYTPVVMDDRQQLVENPTLLTPGHLDRLEAVLARYGEWHQRTDATHLRISRCQSRDHELLWDYTTKAEDGRPAGG